MDPTNNDFQNNIIVIDLTGDEYNPVEIIDFNHVIDLTWDKYNPVEIIDLTGDDDINDIDTVIDMDNDIDNVIDMDIEDAYI